MWFQLLMLEPAVLCVLLPNRAVLVHLPLPYRDTRLQRPEVVQVSGSRCAGDQAGAAVSFVQ